MHAQRFYPSVIDRTTGMVRDPAAQQLAARHGLTILDLTWEDTGRFKESAVGPNISDMTIQVQYRDPDAGGTQLACMPVIRFPNFSDLTGDVPLDRFFLLVGNEKGRPLEKISLRELLGDLRRYLHAPSSWAGERTSLLAERDIHVLASAQACFLPIPSEGLAEFNPVLFNYQSSQGNPAVLTILATREGTSITVIDNVRDAWAEGMTWGQRLFFNQDGQRAIFTARRKSDFVADLEKYRPAGDHGPVEVADGLNMVLLIQVPLKHKELEPRKGGAFAELLCCADAGVCMDFDSDVEDAVIGHGEAEGPFTEIDGLAIERDERFPIRVTVQFYKATSNGVVNEQDLAEIAGQIERVYREADYVGSLVLEADTGRPTEHQGEKVEPPGWWDDFWRRHFANTGQTREQAMQMLQQLLGPEWAQRSAAEAEAALRRADRAGEAGGAKQ
jgi:hypothetical protein